MDLWGFLARLCYCYCCYYYYYRKKQPVNSWHSAEQSELHGASEDKLQHKILRERVDLENQANFDWESELLRIRAQGPERASQSIETTQEASVLQTSPNALGHFWDLTNRLFELVSPEARKERQEREWIAAVISAPTASTERCGHLQRLNSPYCFHLPESETERCEHCLRGNFTSIVKRWRRKGRSHSAERFVEKRSFKLPERHAHHHHHLHPISQLLVRRSSKRTETLSNSANNLALV